MILSRTMPAAVLGALLALPNCSFGAQSGEAGRPPGEVQDAIRLLSPADVVSIRRLSLPEQAQLRIPAKEIQVQAPARRALLTRVAAAVAALGIRRAAAQASPRPAGAAAQALRILPEDAAPRVFDGELRKRDDQLRYYRAYAQELRYYLVENIVGRTRKWPDYENKADSTRRGRILKGLVAGTPDRLEKWSGLAAAAKDRVQRRRIPAVAQSRSFFAHMRAFGLTGYFYLMGFSPRGDQKVIDEAIGIYDRYFRSPDLGKKEKEAFLAFLERARDYNASRRNISYMRKIIRDTMLDASVLPAKKVAAVFSAKLTGPTNDFQQGEAPKILADFQRVVEEEIVAERRLAEEQGQGKSRVTAVVLIGSFATGAATRSSDFDPEVVTADGSSKRVDDFGRRVDERWKALYPDKGTRIPVHFHETALPESKRFLRMMIDTRYLVFSPEKALVEALQAKDGEPAAFSQMRDFGPLGWGRFLRFLHFAAIYLVSYWPWPSQGWK